MPSRTNGTFLTESFKANVAKTFTFSLAKASRVEIKVASTEDFNTASVTIQCEGDEITKGAQLAKLVLTLQPGDYSFAVTCTKSKQLGVGYTAVPLSVLGRVLNWFR